MRNRRSGSLPAVVALTVMSALSSVQAADVQAGKAVAQLVLFFFTCGLSGIWGLIEGIMILTGSIATDANGVPLKG